MFFVLDAGCIEAIKKSAAIAAGKRSQSILSCVCLRNDNGRFCVTGTDIDVEIQAYLPSDHPEPFAFCVDARKLARATGIGKSADMVIGEGSVVIKSGRSKFTLPTLPASDFPFAKNIESEAVELPKGFIDTIRRAENFAGINDVHFYMNGVFAETHAVVATDSRRLIATKTGVSFPQSFILPRAMIKALDDSFERVRIHDLSVQFEGEGLTVIGRRIDHRYIPWEKGIPPVDGMARIQFQADAALEAIQQTLLIVDEKIKLGRFLFSGNECRIVSQSPAGQQAQAESFFETSHCGGEISVTLHLEQILDMLTVFKGKEIDAWVSDSGGASLFVSDEMPDTRIAIMPWRY